MLSEIDFGTITNENGTCTLTRTGALSGTISSCVGSGTVGEYEVAGIKNSTVLLSVFQGSSNGITFTPEIVGQAVTSLGGKARKTFKIIGQIQLNNATSGVIDIDYLISADYQ